MSAATVEIPRDLAAEAVIALAEMRGFALSDPVVPFLIERIDICARALGVEDEIVRASRAMLAAAGGSSA